MQNIPPSELSTRVSIATQKRLLVDQLNRGKRKERGIVRGDTYFFSGFLKRVELYLYTSRPKHESQGYCTRNPVTNNPMDCGTNLEHSNGIAKLSGSSPVEEPGQSETLLLLPRGGSEASTRRKISLLYCAYERASIFTHYVRNSRCIIILCTMPSSMRVEFQQKIGRNSNPF